MTGTDALNVLRGNSRGCWERSSNDEERNLSSALVDLHGTGSYQYLWCSLKHTINYYPWFLNVYESKTDFGFQFYLSFKLKPISFDLHSAILKNWTSLIYYVQTATSYDGSSWNITASAVVYRWYSVPIKF